MIIVSYDISDDKMRTNFSKMLKSNGAIRLQFSVYEVRNTKRIMDNLVAKIEAYAKHFTADDSVILFDVDSDKLTKYGNAIHRKLRSGIEPDLSLPRKRRSGLSPSCCSLTNTELCCMTQFN